jgi:hypothetical protein
MNTTDCQKPHAVQHCNTTDGRTAS